MNLRKYILFIFVLLFYSQISAQVDTAWVRYYNGPGNDDDRAFALAVDNSGNVYVTGYSSDYSFGDPFPYNYDYLTVKYAPNGDTLWVRRYFGIVNYDDIAYALVVDGSGNVCVTGASNHSATAWDYATIKYAPSGDTLWVRRYTGLGTSGDRALAIATDSGGNLYVTGYSSDSGTSADYATIKYAPNGDSLWIRRYNGPGNGEDFTGGYSGYPTHCLAVDDSGNVYVTGSSWSGTSYDYATIKYSSNGDTLWVRRYNGPSNSDDKAYALAIDGSGNVYVTGTSIGSGTSWDYATIKYAPNGDTLWVRRYNGLGNGDDLPYALAVDGNGYLYITGQSFSGENIMDYDYTTIKYASNGDTLWVRRYNGPWNGYNRALAMAVDGNGDVYVTGLSDDYTNLFDYATVKYSPNGDTLWIRRYNGAANSEDYGHALAVDASGNVYVTGASSQTRTLPNSNKNYATIKYVQFTCLAKPGDTDADSTIQVSDVVALVNYLFKSQPAPNPLCRADANADGNVLLSDIVHLINFLFKSGPAPLKSKECCL